MEVRDEIQKIVSEFKQLPYLFVGTGFSIRYSNAMSWDQLLFILWKTLYGDHRFNYEKDLLRIEYELSLSDKITDDKKKYYTLPQMASELQNEFNRRYYKDADFEKYVFTEEETVSIVRYRYDPFKYFVTKQLQNMTIDKSKSEYGELETLIQNQNKVAGIITTNYDECLEQIFADFDVKIGQDNILLSNMNSAFEIYKIHGGVSKPNSIVFTKEDYDYFDEKLKYLSAKLLTIFVEHPVIFIGYGMGDSNIQKIFKEIACCLSKEELKCTKNNFIFISPSLNGEDEIKMRELEYESTKISMTELVLQDYSLFYDCLCEIVSSMPVKLIRMMQGMITKYIYSTKAVNSIMFGSIDSPDIDDSKAAIYVGTVDAISQMGFDSFGIMDIIEDILFDNKSFLLNERLITKTFKNIRSTSGTTYLPLYKYIRGLGMNEEDIPSNYLYIRDHSDIAPNTSDKRNHYVDEEAQFSSIQDIVDRFPDHIPKQFANIKYYANRIEADDLGEYLRGHYKRKTFFEKTKLSTFKKLTAYYDFLKYK